MLGSISPVGEHARRQRWWLTAGSYLVASLVGGAVVGGLFAGAGQLLRVVLPLTPAARLVVLAVVVAIAAALDTRLLPWPLPTWHRQVDERWLGTYRGWVYGAGFGLQLGLGVATIVPSAVTYAMLAAALLTVSVEQGVMIGVTFGAVRALPLLMTATLRSPDRLHVVTGRVAAADASVHHAVVAGQAAIAAVAVLAAL
ncbi:MAG: hypothetical protein GEU74_02575 [Nitriliruptorales bacterium]|nr:hypothetical protein [Nitriliruptorales bacterium]